MLSWWFDLFFLLALLLICYSVYRMHRAGEDPIDTDAEGLVPGAEAEGAERHPARTPLLPGDWRDRVYPRLLIRQAGMLPDDVKLYYWIAKLTFALLLPLVFAELLFTISPLPFILLAVFGYLIVDIWLLLVRRGRKAQIERTLGYFTDLIAAFLHSGLNLADSFEQAAKYGLPPKNPLVREVDLAAREMQAGSDRVATFYALAERTGVPDMLRLAALMSVGYKVGAPIGETLEAQAELLRARQWEQAETLVNRRALEAMFPLVLVSLPLIGVLVFFPAFVQLYEIFLAFSDAL